MPVVNDQGFAGIGSGQPLADQLLQTLARWTANSSEASVVSTIKDDFEPFLASQQFRSPSLADSLDGLNWDEVNSDLDW